MAASNLLEYLRDYGVAQGAWRKPVGTPASRYPLYLEPRDGAPAPGEKQGAENHPDAILSAFMTGEQAPGFFEEFFRRRMVQIWIIARTAPIAYAIDNTIHDLLTGRYNWDMAGLTVQESLQSVALQRHGSDQRGWTFSTTYRFETLNGDV